MNSQKQKEIYMLQVRLFRQAQIKWNLSANECSKLFNRYDIFAYIETCYEFFHIQGDDANLEDIRHYLKQKGVIL